MSCVECGASAARVEGGVFKDEKWLCFKHRDTKTTIEKLEARIEKLEARLDSGGDEIGDSCPECGTPLVASLTKKCPNASCVYWIKLEG